MSKTETYEAAGFSFPTRIQADAALEEEKKIYYIRSRLRKSSNAEVLLIYNKMIKGKVFSTPVGISFLKELHDILVKDPSIKPEEVDAIPYAGDPGSGTSGRKGQEVSLADFEKCRGRLRFCGWVIAALVVCVIAMFTITMKSENPNILNYETAIQNKYAAWEQELSEREKKVREKEMEMELSSQ